ncbi:aminoacetone oxidase family FAD-binding enzyme [Clostridium aminobutyricum]|uniref:Aminoacetone oxidase family FAD-binding enzyme n=1 Tax=Clostridium aminobutyricum TaxID=33953 RepID=A0A939IHW5_CLOAM|nr:aminoacetone oxidase family FAD-binding enzyme [Clostridium aminobutyricum]MBN7771958.1 aminoacetone oxidase family FAD-binding enzyme [Clostridium aminobutyricum]
MESTRPKRNKDKRQNDYNAPLSQIRASYDICIIGGGVSGMTAAIVAAETHPKASVCILEKKETLGKKLLATGNGRCNITNNQCEDFELTEQFLYQHGIWIKHEAEGRMYPKSEQAASVLELLESQLKLLGIEVIVGANVISAVKAPKHLHFAGAKELETEFILTVEQSEKQRTTTCKKLLIASGGKAAPQFGTTGDGYGFARNLGHEVVKIAPALMPICCEGIKKDLKGVRAKGKVTLLKNGQHVVEELGEVQFTEDGLSGICIFNVSRYLKLEEQELTGMNGSLEQAFRQYEIELDFASETEHEELEKLLLDRKKIMAGLPAMGILLSLVPAALAETILSKAGVQNQEELTIEYLSESQIKKLTEELKKSRYTVIGGKGWKFAQCTSGGVSLQEIHLESMESKLVQGLFFAGEVVDYDGPCGGYNLQHAWMTGIKAGRGMAQEIHKNGGLDV